MNIETMRQPNGADIRIEEIGETTKYADGEGKKNSFEAFVYVTYDYGSYHTPYTLKKRLFFDNKGLYTYSKQKTPIYYWKPTNIEQEYETWEKKGNRYYIPLNEPRLLNKNYF